MAIIQKKDTFSPLLKQTELFSDFFTDFDIHPVKKDLVRHVNEEAVKRSIKNLLMTNRKERFFNSDLGSDIKALLFENASPATEQICKEFIKTTIENFEPRARILDIRVAIEEDQHLMTATIVFSVINKQEPIILEVILNRIR